MPFRPSDVRGGEFNHATAPDKDGKPPSTAIFGPGALERAFVIMDGLPFMTTDDCVDPPASRDWGRSRAIKLCSSDAVLESETLARKPVSSPEATAATAINTATPNPRLTQSAAPNERFIVAKPRPPTRRTSASEVAAPAA